MTETEKQDVAKKVKPIFDWQNEKPNNRVCLAFAIEGHSIPPMFKFDGMVVVEGSPQILANVMYASMQQKPELREVFEELYYLMSNKNIRNNEKDN